MKSSHNVQAVKYMECLNITSKMIYHQGGEPERACIADLIFCHGIQTMDSSKICHCRCFMSMVSKKLCAAISPVKEATMLHTHLDKNSQIVSGAYDVIINGP